MIRDEGVIKFECRWRSGPAPEMKEVAELIEYRQRLYRMGLVGVYPDGIGFGNLSVRTPSKGKFIISASQTGHLPEVTAEHFVYVTDYSVDRNWLQCDGVHKASSESLTHAMIYETFPDCDAVIHVHNNQAWKRLLGHIPTTRRDVPYGTPAMGLEVLRLYRETDLARERILVMAGHDDGILSFGLDLAQAFGTLTRNLS